MKQIPAALCLLLAWAILFTGCAGTEDTESGENSSIASQHSGAFEAEDASESGEEASQPPEQAEAATPAFTFDPAQAQTQPLTAADGLVVEDLSTGFQLLPGMTQQQLRDAYPGYWMSDPADGSDIFSVREDVPLYDYEGEWDECFIVNYDEQGRIAHVRWAGPDYATRFLLNGGVRLGNTPQEVISILGQPTFEDVSYLDYHCTYEEGYEINFTFAFNHADDNALYSINLFFYYGDA